MEQEMNMEIKEGFFKKVGKAVTSDKAKAFYVKAAEIVILGVISVGVHKGTDYVFDKVIFKKDVDLIEAADDVVEVEA